MFFANLKERSHILFLLLLISCLILSFLYRKQIIFSSSFNFDGNFWFSFSFYIFCLSVKNMKSVLWLGHKIVFTLQDIRLWWLNKDFYSLKVAFCLTYWISLVSHFSRIPKNLSSLKSQNLIFIFFPFLSFVLILYPMVVLIQNIIL